MESDGRAGGGSLHALLVAVDGGPQESLRPLCAYTGTPLAQIDIPEAASEAHWSNVLAAMRASLLVVGTSDSAHGRRIEAAARRAAQRAGVTIAAIEDFPGNYCDVAQGAASLLVVESAAAAGIARTRLGSRTPELAVVAAARYDDYRLRATGLRRCTAERWSAQQRPCVLWAGQPETADGLATLEHVLPALASCGAALLFKAHPRDSGYLSGAYRELLGQSRVDSCDITACDAQSALDQAPRLVITQFSSVALDAGFHGIPSVWVLLPGAGADRLRQKKGYDIPALCEAGGAGLARTASEVGALVARGLDDPIYRTRLIERFDDYCGVARAGAHAAGESLAQVLRKLQ